MNFHSTQYDWLVVTANGTRAHDKGTGTINGEGDDGFIMTVLDSGRIRSSSRLHASRRRLLSSISSRRTMSA